MGSCCSLTKVHDIRDTDLFPTPPYINERKKKIKKHYESLTSNKNSNPSYEKDIITDQVTQPNSYISDVEDIHNSFIASQVLAKILGIPPQDPRQGGPCLSSISELSQESVSIKSLKNTPSYDSQMYLQESYELVTLGSQKN